MKRALCFAAALPAVLMIASCSKKQSDAEPLICHVESSMVPAVGRIAAAYSEESGVRIELNAVGGDDFAVSVRDSKQGDLCIAPDPLGDVLVRRWRVGVDGWQIAGMIPVIAVRKGNPKKISGFYDLMREDVTVALPADGLSDLGRIVPVVFDKAGVGLLSFLKETKNSVAKNPDAVAEQIAMKQADAGIIWKSLVAMNAETLEEIALPGELLPTPHVETAVTELCGRYFLAPVRVTAVTLASSRQPEEARKFAEFLASSRCFDTLRNFGFSVEGTWKLYGGGETLADVAGVLAGPEELKPVVLISDADLRGGVDALIAAFRKKSGITVAADYESADIARVAASTEADIFLPSDVRIVDQLQEASGKVDSKHDICYLVPVMIVGKGNPRGIKGLEDLRREDLRMIVEDRSSTHIGRLSAGILESANVEIPDARAAVVASAVDAALGVRMKRADAAIVWSSLAARFAEDVDVVQLPKENNRITRVAAALLRTAENREDASRFIEFMTGAEGRRILEQNGYAVNL